MTRPATHYMNASINYYLPTSTTTYSSVRCNQGIVAGAWLLFIAHSAATRPQLHLPASVYDDAPVPSRGFWCSGGAGERQTLYGYSLMPFFPFFNFRFGRILAEGPKSIVDFFIFFIYLFFFLFLLLKQSCILAVITPKQFCRWSWSA